MRPHIPPFQGLALIAGLALCSSAFAEETAFELEPGLRVLAPLTHRQLAVFPVVQDAAVADKTGYLTLAAGLEGKKIQVLEQKDGGQVNQVTVANNSNQPLLLLGGEIILGGQQDRVMSKDTIIGPKSQALVSVFCVEHGRWSGRREFTSSGGMVEAKLRSRAKFEANQQRVWDQVAEKTASLGAGSQTGTYRTLGNGEQGQRTVKPYRDAMMAGLDALPERKKVVGVIAAISGKVIAVDVFANPDLFTAYRNKLLDSLFVTAADAPEVPGARAPAAKDIKDFIAKADKAVEQEVLKNGEAQTLEKKGAGVSGSRLQTIQVIRGNAEPPKSIYRSYQAAE